MKRFFFLLTFCLCFLHQGITQNVSINTTGDTAHASAILDISSINKGILVPRMDSYQRSMIVNPAQGLLVYDTTTRSFWFYDGAWEEIGSSGGPGGPSGPASGDLSDNYPSPTVAKIQNLDVAFGVPFDKQVLKWDAINNNWKGRNDSLFLPYNVAFGSPTKLFGITNNNTTGGSSAIYGRSGTISGIAPGFTMGVWGDSGLGQGVAGTSSNGNGVFGSSIYHHGITGYSGNTGYAGVYGSNLEYGGIGVMGEMEDSDGIAIVGSILGANGKAAVFQTPTTNHSDTTFVVTTNGTGMLSMLNVANTTNNKPALDIEHAGTGSGLKVRLNKVASSGNGIDAHVQGGGTAVYGKSENGIAGKFENTNAANSNPPMLVSNQGLGTSIYVSSLNTGVTGPALDVFSLGAGGGINVLAEKGKAGTFTTTDPNAFAETFNSTTEGNAPNAIFNSNNAGSFEPGVSINQAGRGNGLKINLTNPSNTFAGLYLNTLGNRGMDVISAGTIGMTVSASANNAVAISANTGQTANNAIAIKGVTGVNVSNGIGVLGQAGVNDSNGIGVKGIAGGNNDGGIGVLGETSANTPQAIAVKGIGYSHNEDVGAITGINMVDGVGVFGEALGFDGIGIAGTVGNANQHSVAGVFTNTYTENNRSVVEVITNGKGNGILIDHNHLTNTSPLLRMSNSGNGDFVRLESGLGDIKTTINKAGNIVTDGSVKVDEDKGIVRNSTSDQLRMEIITATIPADFVPKLGEFNIPSHTEIDFGTAFSSPPAVSLGNLISGGIGWLTLTIEEVTTTGCTIVLWNYTGTDLDFGDTTYKLIVVGVDNN